MKIGKRTFLILFIVWLPVFLVTPGLAIMSDQISFQGKLADSAGLPVADDTYTITFAIYNAPSGGTTLWSETNIPVTVANGVFNVRLPHDPGTFPFPADLFDNELYIGVKVDTDAEMTPRQLLTAVPFAFKAADAESLDGRIADEFADAAHSHEFADINGTIADGQVPDDITVDHAAHATDADFAGDADNLDGLDSSGFAAAVHGHDFSVITGLVSDAQVPNNITIDYAAEASIAAQAANADTVDGQHAGDFMAAGTDNWVNTTGDTMSGRLEVETNILGSGWGESVKGILNTSENGAGVYGISGGTDSYGVAGGATGANGAGVYGETTGSNGIGVKGYATGTSGIGVYGEGPEWAGYFAGNIYTSGSIYMPSNSHIVNGDGRQVFHTGWSGLFGDYTTINSGYDWSSGEPVSVVAGANGVFFTKGDASGNPFSETLAKVDTNGKLSCAVLEITGGSDLAEPFETRTSEAIIAGSVMVIDPNHVGRLKLSRKSYDRGVAGVVSGAGGINPGMMLTQKGSTLDGTTPIALSGRVYCLADASAGPIKPGDLLTTADLPGHAMRVTDYQKAHGATLGKAMSALENGQGMVLVLVGLQ